MFTATKKLDTADVDFINIFGAGFSLKNSSLFWKMVNGEQHTDSANFKSQILRIWLRSLRQIVGEIEWRIFRQTMCASVFSLGKKVW